MNKQFVLDLLKKGESEVVEFKTTFDQATIETLTAFANTKGGTVIVGVKNTGNINGIQLGKETVQQWLNQIKASTFPFLFKVTQKTTQKATQKTTRKKVTKDKILDALRENPKITRDEIASMLGKSPNTIKEHLARLKAEGRLERIGSDREGYWKAK
ncbi:MAG: winged helix-turn-helix transcriptional regulator [Acidobacteria bacterium]|nr:winged helix-turn-helix transcriptional regulator [Acidobacteriota bacterium]MBU4307775.1 winged helix-turn-helix transcriptional regulator [Acidobacteriota bacterium]MCG2810385.1 winged helix-turn-helix transcriptional regulator [Candidatus Aminicenantes bacterium]